MNHLAHRPALWPVRRIQLCVAQAGDRLAEAHREAFDRVDSRAAQLVSDRHDGLESTDGIAEVVGCVRRHGLFYLTVRLKPDTTSNPLMSVAATILVGSERFAVIASTACDYLPPITHHEPPSPNH